jgi:hypothetical protein
MHECCGGALMGHCAPPQIKTGGWDMKQRAWLLTLIAVMAVGLLTTGCDRLWEEPEATFEIARTVCGEPKVVTIWAGQHIDAGTVTVQNCEDSMCVKIETSGDWVITESHFAIGNSCEGLPRNKKGNLVPGRFQYTAVNDPPVTEYRYCIPIGDWEPGDTVYIAVHVVVARFDEGGELLQEETGWADSWKGCFWYEIQECYKDVTLPTYPIRLRGFYPGTSSYWRIQLDGINETGYNVWNGDQWLGWCSEKTVGMYPGRWYTVTLLSSQDPNMPDRVKYGTYRGLRRWDCVNWLLNNKPTGLTNAQMQNIVWYLVGELAAMPSGLAVYINQALTEGTGFRPEIGQWIAVVTLTPQTVQLCFIEVDP